ncbi:MAG TPA: hypothetical protein VMT47_18455 [Polyangia bacterium]|nr:hypothetical protein [Polyangia bacterium]
MLKKLAIPCFLFATSVVIGCSSSSPNGTGTGGKGGGTAGGAAGGTAGMAGGTAGAAGGTAGAAGGAAGAAGGTAGAAGGTAGAAGGTAGAAGGTAGAAGGTAGSGSDAGAGSDGGGMDTGARSITVLKAECLTKTSSAATAFSAADFCALYQNVCGGTIFTGMLTEANCVAMYTGWASKKVNGMPAVAVQSCTTYHLCNANAGGLATHCPHAAAVSMCDPAP